MSFVSVEKKNSLKQNNLNQIKIFFIKKKKKKIKNVTFLIFKFNFFRNLLTEMTSLAA